jgi:hypothetical protein
MASKYRVTGEQPVVWDEQSYEKGQEFTADIPPNDEQVLLASGAVVLASGKTEKEG